MRAGKTKIGKVVRLVIMAAVLVYAVSVLVREEKAEPEVVPDEAEVPQSRVKTEEGLIIEYEGFTVSYSPENRIPNWVKYELTAEETDGPFARKGKRFRPDENLSVSQAKDTDYRNSGWVRGHMAPAADFKWSDEAMWDTFYFTNCCPQNDALNGGQWKTLEKKARDSAVKYGKVSIITGPIVGENIYGTIGENKVVVPDAFFKTMMATDTPSGPQSVAFIMYNQEHNANIQTCAMSVNDLEAFTGYDFFSELDDSIEEKMEDGYTLKYWGL